MSFYAVAQDLLDWLDRPGTPQAEQLAPQRIAQGLARLGGSEALLGLGAALLAELSEVACARPPDAAPLPRERALTEAAAALSASALALVKGEEALFRHLRDAVAPWLALLLPGAALPGQSFAETTVDLGEALRDELPQPEELSPLDTEGEDPAVLFVRVVDAGLRPRPGVLCAISGPGLSCAVVTDAAGELCVDGCIPGAYRLSAHNQSAICYTLFTSDLTLDPAPYLLII